jgi:hypothetical protein
VGDSRQAVCAPGSIIDDGHDVSAQPRPESPRPETVAPAAGTRSGILGWIAGMRFRQFVSIPFWLAAVTALAAGDLVPALMPVSRFYEAGKIGNMITAVGILCLWLASRLGASTARQILAMHPGIAPVLYLRSFRADRNPFTTATDEELLSRIFRTIGPFLAFEEPGERLPEIGSAKMSVDNADWQRMISEQMERAQLVVLNVGTTPSFRWEVRRVLELVRPERVLVYFSIHADEYNLRSMYSRFVEMAGPMLRFPLPAEDEIGERRFLRFDADGRPELFGSVPKPRTAWRKWIGISSFGIGLIILRPFVVERWRQRLSNALAPLRSRFEDRDSSTMVWGRLTLAAGIYLGGLAAFLPMLAWNYWHAGSRRAAGAATAGLGLLALAPVNDYFTLVSFAVAVLAYLAWPMIMPVAARRHIALGGPVFGVSTAAVLIILAVAMSLWLPSSAPGLGLERLMNGLEGL